ncbi:hypothetical protein ACP70R_019516 [Stipagrostis hirtigluma subsp. patula]
MQPGIYLHTMKAMELRVVKRLHMSAVAILGRAMLRRSSSSLDRRITIRRHGTKTSVSGMNHRPKSTTNISGFPSALADGSANFSVLDGLLQKPAGEHFEVTISCAYLGTVVDEVYSVLAQRSNPPIPYTKGKKEKLIPEVNWSNAQQKDQCRLSHGRWRCSGGGTVTQALFSQAFVAQHESHVLSEHRACALQLQIDPGKIA